MVDGIRIVFPDSTVFGSGSYLYIIVTFWIVPIALDNGHFVFWTFGTYRVTGRFESEHFESGALNVLNPGRYVSWTFDIRVTGRSESEHFESGGLDLDVIWNGQKIYWKESVLPF